jgi:DNA polymerase-3 subunit beta
MRIKIEKELLQEAIQSIVGVVSTKNTLPILSNILIEAEKDTLKLTTTDLDIGMSKQIQANVIEDGGITAPAKRMVDIIKELPNKTIEIYTKKNNTIFIECEGVAFKILGVPKEEFPKLPAFTEKENLVIEQPALKKMLSMTVFAMSRDETRYVLNGICFIINKDHIKMVATDGRRLAIISQANKTGLKAEKKIIIPAKTTQELLRSLKDAGETKIVFSKNQAMFQIDNLIIISRLIEGEFPNYEQAIPKQVKNKLKVNQEDLFSAIKRASLLTTPESQAIRFQLQKNRLAVSKTTPEIGEVKEDLVAEYGGEEFLVGFNPGYLMDALKTIEEKELEIELSGPEKPGVIRIKDDYIYIVLPMQIA